MSTTDKEQQLISWLMAHEQIQLAILFGSYAKGTANSRSDIDLGIQFARGKTLSAEDKLDYLTALTQLLQTDIDLVDLNTVGQPLLSQIIQYGRLLKGNLNDYAALAIKNINTTQDFMPYINRMLAVRRKRWLNHG